MSVRMPTPNSDPIKDAFTLLRLVADPQARAAELEELTKGRQAYEDARLAADARITELRGMEPGIEARHKEADERIAAVREAEASLEASRDSHLQNMARERAESTGRMRELSVRELALQDATDAVTKRETWVAQETHRLAQLQDALEAKEKRLNEWHSRLTAAVAE